MQKVSNFLFAHIFVNFVVQTNYHYPYILSQNFSLVSICCVINVSQALAVDFTVMHNINMRLVNRLHVALSWVDSQRGGAVDSSDGDAIAWLNFVDHVIVGKHYNRVRGLSGWHVL